MATPIHAPRINNNDDEIKVLAFDVAVGGQVSEGQIVGQVETDKAVLDVTAPCAGYVLGFVAAPEDVVKVGSVMLWLGERPDEPVPEPHGEDAATGGTDRGAISAKARLLIKKHGLSLADIPPIDGRITVEAVERYLAGGGGGTSSKKTPREAGHASAAEPLPEVAGTAVDLSREEKGMAATVSWHRDFPAPGYIEIEYELAPWAEYAKRFQEEKGLMVSPLLPLMAWRLVEIAGGTPRLNATLVGGKRYEYGPVNLGFTIQAGESLYLAVVREAANLGEEGFINALGEVLRRAAGHKLRESEASGATIGFSSMERWKVTRHIPVLPPNTAFMVAHAAGQDGKGVIGATYDHRILNGGQVVAALRQLAKPKTA